MNATTKVLDEQFADERDLSLYSVAKVADRLGLRPEHLARLAQIEPEAVQSNRASAELQTFLGNVVRVVVLASEVFGSGDSAAAWMTALLESFGGQTALALIAEGRVEDVIGYLHSIESGFVG